MAILRVLTSGKSRTTRLFSEHREEILQAYKDRSSLHSLCRTFGISATPRPPRRKSRSGTLTGDNFSASRTDYCAGARRIMVVRHPEDQSGLIMSRALSSDTQSFCQGRQCPKYGNLSLLVGTIPAAYRAMHCSHDFWEAYAEVLPPDQHTAVSKHSGQANHVERFTSTL